MLGVVKANQKVPPMPSLTPPCKVILHFCPLMESLSPCPWIWAGFGACLRVRMWGNDVQHSNSRGPAQELVLSPFRNAAIKWRLSGQPDGDTWAARQTVSTFRHWTYTILGELLDGCSCVSNSGQSKMNLLAEPRPNVEQNCKQIRWLLIKTLTFGIWCTNLMLVFLVQTSKS